MNIPIFKNEKEILISKTYKALSLLNVNKKEYEIRLEKELNVIINKKFASYFLIVSDYVLYAKENNIKIGPGRGSCVSSLVSYLLGITEIDPLKYNLMFERFISEDRLELPDIDIDIESEKRDIIFQYLIKKYGYNHVARFLDSTKKSMHASGIIISNLDLINADHKKQEVLLLENTQDEFNNILVKFDILSSNLLTSIKELENETNFIFNVKENSFNNKFVFKLLNTNLLSGLFQVSSSLYKNRLSKMNISSLEELANALALIRAPFLSIKADKKYIKAISSKTVESINSVYDRITSKTFGVLLYQEQLIELLNSYGFTMTESYSIIKKLSKNISVKEYKNKFFEKCKDNGEKIWNIIESMGLYSFNKSHAIAYASLVYITAYYKVFFTKEFFSVMLTKAYKNKKYNEVEDLQLELKSLGIKLLPADFKKSSYVCKTENNAIRLGLVSIFGIGEHAANTILKSKSLFNNHDIRTLIPLIFSGVFDSIYEMSRFNIYKMFMEITGKTVQTVFSLSKTVHFNKDTSNKELDSLLMKII